MSMQECCLTGALSRDLVSQETVDSLIDSTSIDISNAKCSSCSCIKKFRVCSGLDGHCTDTNEIDLVINLTSETGENLTISTKALILPDTPM